jgi:hypothetical protein
MTKPFNLPQPTVAPINNADISNSSYLGTSSNAVVNFRTDAYDVILSMFAPND